MRDKYDSAVDGMGMKGYPKISDTPNYHTIGCVSHYIIYPQQFALEITIFKASWMILKYP